MKHSCGQIIFGFSGHADGLLVLQFSLQAPDLLCYLDSTGESNTGEEEQLTLLSTPVTCGR